MALQDASLPLTDTSAASLTTCAMTQGAWWMSGSEEVHLACFPASDAGSSVTGTPMHLHGGAYPVVCGATGGGRVGIELWRARLASTFPQAPL